MERPASTPMENCRDIDNGVVLHAQLDFDQRLREAADAALGIVAQYSRRLGERAWLHFDSETRVHTVWERPAEGWRVFVNADAGAHFEVFDPGATFADRPTAEKGWAAWGRFRAAMGLPADGTCRCPMCTRKVT